MHIRIGTLLTLRNFVILGICIKRCANRRDLMDHTGIMDNERVTGVKDKVAMADQAVFRW